MGWITTTNYRTGKEVLCCDIGAEGCNQYPVVKIKCPFGYCQSYAMCKSCRSKREFRGKLYKQKHKDKGCKEAHEEFQKHEVETSLLLNAGNYLLASANTTEDGWIKLLFRNKEGNVRAFFIVEGEYIKPKWGDPSTGTLAHYERTLKLKETQNLDVWNRETEEPATTKQVV